MNNVFLTEGKGLTSTSATFLANLAKEQLKQTESQLEHLTYITKTVGLISSPETKVIQYGSTLTELSPLLKKIANLHSFIAWIREAIKCKEELLNKIENLNINDYCKIKEIEVPKSPAIPVTVQTSDILKEMNIKERNNYLTLEAFASTFGKYIHPDGAIAEAREDAIYREQLPHEVSGDGRDTLIYTHSLTVPVKELDKVFNELQSSYRDYERKLNALKFQIKEEVNKRNLQNNKEYSLKLSEYKEQTKELNNKLNAYIIEGREEISKLKIVIPEKLQDTYEYLESLTNVG